MRDRRDFALDHGGGVSACERLDLVLHVTTASEDVWKETAEVPLARGSRTADGRAVTQRNRDFYGIVQKQALAAQKQRARRPASVVFGDLMQAH